LKIPEAVAKETKNIAIGLLIGDILILGIFLAIGKFDYTVLHGLGLGSFAAIANFFYLGMSIQKALSKGSDAKKYMYVSYTKRMLLYGACIVLAGVLPSINIFATVIPLFVPRIVIYILQFSGHYKPEDFEKAKDGDSLS